MVVV
jgi:hypothetical protein